MTNPVTHDLREFGLRELKRASMLLESYKSGKDKTQFLGDDVRVCFNKNSGYVFLTDSDYNTAMLDDRLFLQDFLYCPECGYEELSSDFRENAINNCCKEQADEYDV